MKNNKFGVTLGSEQGLSLGWGTREKTVKEIKKRRENKKLKTTS